MTIYLTHPAVNNGAETLIDGTLSNTSGRLVTLTVQREVYDRTIRLIGESPSKPQPLRLRVTEGDTETVGEWNPVSAMVSSSRTDVCIILESDTSKLDDIDQRVRQEAEKRSWTPELTGLVRNILERYRDVVTSTDMICSKTHEEPHLETYEATLVQLLMLGIAAKLDCLESTGAPLHNPSLADVRKWVSELQANPLSYRDEHTHWP